MSLPANMKGLGNRRLDDFVGYAAYAGGWNLVVEQLIGTTNPNGTVNQGLFPYAMYTLSSISSSLLIWY